MNIKDINDKHGNVIRVCYDLQVVNYEAKKNIKNLVLTAEKSYHDQIKNLVEQVVKGKYKVIFITGPSSAGKTTSSKLISECLKAKEIQSIIISTDDFFYDREDTPKLSDGSYDFDNVTAVDAKCFKNFLNQLVNDGESKMPIFDFYHGKRMRYVDIKSNKEEVIIIEGTHAMNPILTNEVNDIAFKVYVNATNDFILGREVVITSKILRLMRRCIRDHYKRGNTIDETIKIWKHVCKSEQEFITPFRRNADFILDTTHMYEPLLYDFYLKPLLIKAKNNVYTRDFKNVFSKTGSLNKNVVPDDSLLWEFLIKD